ncbi:MAG: sigma-70 family RNA polymerase sigma factor [Balneolaceae bacterium]|nr:sigma-70 family RNA polymerase sigma factor [Balneolaceae bacterium]
MESSDKEKDYISDEALWKELQSGQKEALSTLFERFYDSLYGYGYRIIPEDDRIKDSIQETFLQLWKYRNNLSSVNSVRAYLLMSFRHQLFNDKAVQDRRKKMNEVYATEEFEIYVNYEKWLDILELEEEQKSLLKKAVNELSPRQREAVYLKYYEGLSTEELSKVMNLRTQSIYNLMVNALKELRKRLDR